MQTMVKKKTWIIPADRSGVWWVRTFHLYKGFSRKSSFVGDFVRASVRSTRPNNWIRKKAKVHGILVRTRWRILKRDGCSFKFFQNNITLLKKRMTPRGTENFGPIPFTVKRKKFINSYAGIIF